MYKHLLILIFLAPSIFSQDISVKFFEALIQDKPELTDFINKEELEYSLRLGIEYDNVKNKFFIGNEIPEEIREGVISGKYEYNVAIEPHAGMKIGDTRFALTIPDIQFRKEYYYNDGMISATTFYTRKWQKLESKYFTFRLEEPKYFNEYCVKRLDQFVDLIADTLGFTIAERRILEKEKIGYIFCKDEASVEKITGFKAKGMAMLGTDEIVTSYQTHFHEVAHILINYKLKKSGLYTLPFFMEGFAVAVGGRGGMAPRVVTDLGYYLEKSSILTYDSIITNDGFYNNDASMSYAVAGLYNSFLLNELGGKKYLELYRKVNGDLEYLKGLNSFNLPTSNNWVSFLEYYSNDRTVYFDAYDTNTFFEGGNIGSIDIFKNGNIKFTMPGYIFVDFLNNKISKSLYKSRIFLADFPQDSSKWEFEFQYGVFADSVSLKVIDYFNDEILINYNKNLAIENLPVPHFANRFKFSINGKLFNLDESGGYVISGIILRSLYYK
ncbi:MAG TPA: hypothetical protein PK605_02970 [Ignavibacteria bacterium]|nr:hypothetical protein [Ignavibacteria bacterium]HRF65622.1 hypothetical protein [Ignavibacteria bacterium]HRJ03346.1 hypothetical protein [Ignavibacteria bacterium]